MKYLWKKIRPLFRGCYRIYNVFIGYLYDFNRSLFYGGWKGSLRDCESRNYQLIMLYHGLEKSLSYKQRDPRSGWRNAEKIIHLLKFSYDMGEVGTCDKAAKQVLEKFLSLPENKNTNRAEKIHNELQQIDFDKSRNKHGAKEYTLNNFLRGALQHPEDFFLSRYSLREFKNEKVSSQVIMKAIKLALKTPSACNRQPWHIYHTADRKVISSVLEYQRGNKPFGNVVPNLIVVTTDLKAFFGGNEHYQHWIEGGLFAMSMMYAFHSLGIATCALNWSQFPQKDKALRKIVNIQPYHSIILMLAVGYPNQLNKVCCSARKSVDDINSTLNLKKI